ncbi:membrane protein [Sphingobacterium mizutaii NBRC 14946 = DSM 11724]|uniref:SusD family n=2 Tax=Sphingobacterium mizutaii TaxID=1010 RepID=A0AAJ4XAF9_9SPHI|nr:RagB/SusD family nutrient uptake outer membrane protein [Sphingobacterium mizutaii]GEM67888.1 membrane protein [Sphingobacterium mizutaii NBRC 14946 = DSM 11724]SDK95217.1 SusD family protein [Sphingobacterium mizutaii]SNV48725.1 SusD family [Sphingobacterium mizutaii]
MKRMFKTAKYLGFLALMLNLSSCKDFLKEEVYSQLAPENYLNTKEGLTSVLYEAYAKGANMNSNNSIYVLGPQEFSTDILYQSGDNVEATIKNYREFNWDPTMDFLIQNWDSPYQCIRDANIILENIDKSNLTDAEKALFAAEARFLRATSYYKLSLFFGPVPLRTSTTQELSLKRATQVELNSFIENELLETIKVLPNPGNEPQHYRAHKAAAMGFLIKFYLNSKQWQKSADLAKQFINDFNYSLHPVYKDLFKVENERNKEYIWVRPAIPSSDRVTANSWSNVSFPENFKSAPEIGLTFKSTWLNWPNEFRIYDDFYNSFENNDNRKELMITKYINNSDVEITLLGNDNVRSFKYWPDQNNTGAAHGNDIPEIRFADIYLSLAEALNETQYPNQEALKYINMVRKRAGLNDLIASNITSKEMLRNLILTERGHEFYNEGHRRTDMIRMGVFISDAIKRGKAAKPYQVVFPIPQVVIDSDTAIEQNENY